MSEKPSPNDQRSVVKHPPNPAYQADRDNRIRQGHGDVPPAPPAAAPASPKQK